MANNIDNFFLSGNYAPVHDELDVDKLKVIGEIPVDLQGVYMRNGPNPEFPPIAYAYPFDGDGMIHAVTLRNGSASYRNRYVQTKYLLKERKAGKALYGGILHPVSIDPKWLDQNEDPMNLKNGAFIHIIRHAKKYLAFSEGSEAYEMTAQLNTVGEWIPDLAKDVIPVCPHTRLDPRTGDLWCINYALVPPYLTIYQINSKGALVHKWDIDKPHSTMIHDFVLTENYVVIFECPAVFDLDKIKKGGDLLSWRPELGVRVGVFSRDTGKMMWYQTDAFFVFHFANAYEFQQEIIIDFVRHETLPILTAKVSGKQPTLHRVVLNLTSNIITSNALHDNIKSEFPRIREDVDSFPHQFIYTAARSTKNEIGFDTITKHDVNNQNLDMHYFGDDVEVGEAVFAPSAKSKNEDDGYVMLFTHNNATNVSEFVILNARHIKDEPVARIIIPRRVPFGLHGSWMPDE